MKSADIRIIDNCLYDSSFFDVRWRITTLCNYQCAFCIQGNREEHMKQAEGESLQLRKNICGGIIRMIEKLKGYSGVKVTLIGGELTILEDFPEILERLVLCRFPGEIRFGITTNFSQSLDYFCRLFDIVQDRPSEWMRSLTVGTSYYSAYAERRQFAEKLRKAYKYSDRERISVTVGIPILEDADYDCLNRMRSEFRDTDIRISPIYIRNYETSVSPRIMQSLYEQEEKNIRVTDKSGRIYMFQNIQALGASLEETDSFCPRGYMCDAGIRNVWIDAFGNMKRCPAIGSDMYLGNILDGNWELPDAPQICTSDHCSCSQYGRIEI